MSGPVKLSNGITAATWNRVGMDSGIVFQDWGLPGQRLLGATSGGNTFTIEVENREMVVDGSAGPIKGSQRRIKSTGKLVANIVEITDDNIKLLLPGVNLAALAAGTKFTRDCQIKEGDYVGNITLFVMKGGTDELIGLTVKNCLNLGNFEFGASEDAEAIFPLEMTAHFDPANMAEEPWEVFNPEEVAAVTHNLTYIAGVNGTVVGNTSQIIPDGGNGTEVAASPDAGFVFDDWSDASTDQFRTDLAVSTDISVTANFVAE